MLVLKGLVGLHRIIELQLFSVAEYTHSRDLRNYGIGGVPSPWEVN